MDECGSRLRTTISKGFDAYLLHMEDLGLLNPVIDCGGNRGHRKNHGGNSLVYSERELVDQGDVIGDHGFVRKVLEISDVFLESIINGSIREVGSLLDELG